MKHILTKHHNHELFVQLFHFQNSSSGPDWTNQQALFWSAGHIFDTPDTESYMVGII